jgi:signal transduction histidine kinase
VEAQKKGDLGSAQELLDRALEMSREAGHQISKPLDELRLFYQNGAPTAFFKERFEKFGADFGFEIHEDLQVPLEVLGRAEIAVAHRVGIEALWNTARHARSRNLWLESYLIGSVFVLEVRDDGRGFRPEEGTEGLGLRFMRSRAEGVGANLDVISAPGKGTTVQLRFDTK